MTTTPTAGDPVETVPAVVNTNLGVIGARVVSVPTQVRRPWRSTLRTFVQTLIPAVLSLCVVVPEIVEIVLDETGESMPEHFRLILLAISGGCATLAAILARVMAIARVETLLRRFKLTRGWLSAAPAPVEPTQRA